MNDKPPCKVCKGSYDEHFNDKGEAITQHVYTDAGGDLKTHAQAAEERKSTLPAAPSPMLQYMGNAGLSVARLTELLMEKGILSTQEALYISGISATKPIAPSGFQDPLAAMRKVD